MPFYDVRCKKCENKFSIRATIQEKENGLQPVCLVCQAPETQQIITAGILLGKVNAGNGRLPSPFSCGPGTGSGCCG